MSKKWLINLKPKKDELLSSWLIRTAIINGDDPIGWTQNFWGKWRAWTTDLDRQCPTDKISSISKVSGVSESQLTSMTLQPTIEQLLKTHDLNSSIRWPWVIPNGKRNRTSTNGLHFCTDCISNEPVYFKKSWRLAWNVACPTHRTLLSLNCPECGTVVSPHLITYKKTLLNECVHCGYDLKNTPTTKAIDEVIEFQELLNLSLVDKNALNRKQQKIAVHCDIKTSEELFEVTLFLMKFFYSVRRFKSTYKTLISSLGITKESDGCPTVKGGVIESLPVQYRHFLLLATIRFLSLDKSEIVELLHSADVTQQRLSIVGEFQSKFILDIGAQLIDTPQRKNNYTHSKKEILPRSKQEVELLMDEVRSFL